MTASVEVSGETLGAFLRTCRDRMTPEALGLSSYGTTRRVPGLRREELAQLAGLSAGYYTRLEQGQAGRASSQVLDALAGLRGSRDAEREAELMERFDLDPSKRVRTYSKGNRQKVALVAALAAPTSLLVLDEPTSGLDPLMERVFTEEVARACGEGRTVLLSSHILAEVQRLCSAVTIIKNGRVVEHGDLGTLRRLSRTRIELGAAADELGTIRQALEALGLDVVEDGGRLSLEVPAEQVPTVLSLAGEHRIQDVTCEPTSLEDLFLRHYEEA